MFWCKKKPRSCNEFQEQLNRIEELYKANERRTAAAQTNLVTPPSLRRGNYSDTVRYFIYGNFAEATPIQDLEKKGSVRLTGFRNAIAREGALSAVQAYLDSNNVVRLRRVD